MKKTIIAAGIGASLTISALTGIAPAQAFTDSESPSVAFLAHVKALGFTGATSDRDIVNVGYGICTSVRGGSSITDVQGIAEIAFQPKGYTKDDADQFVTYAIADLCPHAVN
jgi:Protein of unknown function (DUF732)